MMINAHLISKGAKLVFLSERNLENDSQGVDEMRAVIMGAPIKNESNKGNIKKAVGLGKAAS